MMDDFLIRALAAGIGTALVAGPLGCFVIWRRMAYFGDTMAHAALLGVALSLLLQVNLTLAVFVVAGLSSLMLFGLERRRTLPIDALLGILAHSTLALGLVLVALMDWVRVDLLSYLFGDILAVGISDIAVIWGGGALVLILLAVIWRSLLAGTVSEELAEAEGLRPARARIGFMLAMALTIAIAMKVVGILLITSLLIIPAATARRFATTPEQMAVFAALTGVVAVIAGLGGSFAWDTPSGPSIVVAALIAFLLSLIVRREAASR
ncbi:zinc ABC transporter permease subunit ZnuB [Minwuia sp.]|uniref:zinc ABC transporter permease subunit ZnuB n=1 Tax=Minwuia sp. TaxID=2493630 RepID=UPI003A926AE9